MGSLNRRSLFAFGGGLMAATALPVGAAAMAGPRDPWDAKIAALAAFHPTLGTAAEEARKVGWTPDELVLIFCRVGEEPFLQFQGRFYDDQHPRTFPVQVTN